MTKEKAYTEHEAHGLFARNSNGHVWGLLEKTDRTKQEAELMVHAAHASLYHWLKVGTAVNHQRGEWLIARAYSELGLAEAALRHAQRCRELTEQYAGEMEDFDRAYSHECLARAQAVAGELREARKLRALAEEAGQAIADGESKKCFFGDLNSGNWGDLS